VYSTTFPWYFSAKEKSEMSSGKIRAPNSPGPKMRHPPVRFYTRLAALSALCFFAVPQVIAQSQDSITYLGQSALEGQKLPFSEAVRVGNLLFLSGQIGLDPETGKLVAGGIQPETRQTLENIKVTLDKYASSMSQVIKCTVFLADISEWSDMNQVYVEFFSVNLPARSALGTSGLALGARTEIECLAYVDSKKLATRD
jgi:reactive intermediate/imine deaminase